MFNIGLIPTTDGSTLAPVNQGFQTRPPFPSPSKKRTSINLEQTIVKKPRAHKKKNYQEKNLEKMHRGRK